MYIFSGPGPRQDAQCLWLKIQTPPTIQVPHVWSHIISFPHCAVVSTSLIFLGVPGLGEGKVTGKAASSSCDTVRVLEQKG